MRRLRRFLIRLTTSATRRHDEGRLREELDDHLARQTDDNMRAGLPAAEARRQAVLKFGAVEAIKEDYRDQQGLPFVEHLLQDVRIALRRMRQAPGFTAAAIATLALGLGLTSAVLSLAYALFLKPLPVDDASRIVFVDRTLADRPVSNGFPMSYPDYAYYRDHARTFADLAAHYSTSPMNVVTPAGPFNVTGSVVTANYFSLLRLQPAIGRFFTVEEDRVPGRNPVAVLSHDLWRTRFGADAGILGTAVRINGTAFTVVGIAPERFHGMLSGLEPNDVWIPTAMFGVGYRYCDGPGAWLQRRESRRPSVTRRVGRRGAGRDGGAGAATRGGVSGDEHGTGRSRAPGPRHPDRGAGQRRADRRPAGVRRRARAARRVRQRRGLAARARPAPPEGDRDPPRARRQPRPADSSVARRVRHAGDPRRRGGPHRRDLVDRHAAGVSWRRPDGRAQPRSFSRPARRVGRRRRGPAHRRGDRHRARASVHAARPGRRDEGGVGRRRRAPFSVARRADRRAGGVVRVAPRQQRSARPQLPHAAPWARLRSQCRRRSCGCDRASSATRTIARGRFSAK